jgi:4-carboxymuconolactone decarboxylase
MARIPYATTLQYEELLREIRFPEDTVPSNAFGMLAHAPAIGSSVLRLIYTILGEADLDFGLRELAILHVSRRCQAWYVWAQHIAIARAIGVDDEQIAGMERGEFPSEIFSRRERIVLAFTDEVIDNARVPDQTFAQARDEFSARELVELLLTIGSFRMISSLLTTLDIELDAPHGAELLEMACEAA